MSVDKMDEDIKELSWSECISYSKPFVFPARFSDGHRCRFCNDHMRPVGYIRRKEGGYDPDHAV